MPHGLLKGFKSQLSALVAAQIGALKAMAITYINLKINEFIEYLKRQCPPPEVLKVMAAVVGQLNDKMNTIDKKTQALNKIPPKLDPAIAAAKIIIEILAHQPLPAAIGTPPGPAGGLIVAVPTGVIQQQSNTLVFMRDMVDAIENDKNAIKAIIQSTSGIFTPIRAKLAIIENILARCAQDPNLSDEERKELINSIQGTTTDPSQSGVEYTSTTNGRTYTLSVLIDEASPEIATRRYAIAKDFRGIVVLRGPSSFASSEQILIDELKFRIDNQLP